MYECTTKKSDKVGRIIVLQYGSSALSSALALLWNFYAFRGKRKTFQINQSICARACVWCALRLNMWLQSLFSVASHPSLTLHRDSGPSKTSSWSKTSLEFTDFILYNNKIVQSYATVSFSTVIIRASRLRCVSVCVCVCVCVCPCGVLTDELVNTLSVSNIGGVYCSGFGSGRTWVCLFGFQVSNETRNSLSQSHSVYPLGLTVQ